MMIFVAGPIDYFWNENWHTPLHLSYMAWRDEVKTRLVEAGHLVYSPDQAFKGAWDERGQEINDLAIRKCDTLIYLTPPNVPAHGTAAEVAYAKGVAVPVFHAPPGDYSQITHLIEPLDDPYGDVQRKSYSKIKPYLDTATTT